MVGSRQSTNLTVVRRWFMIPYHGSLWRMYHPHISATPLVSMMLSSVLSLESVPYQSIHHCVDRYVFSFRESSFYSFLLSTLIASWKATGFLHRSRKAGLMVPIRSSWCFQCSVPSFWCRCQSFLGAAQ